MKIDEYKKISDNVRVPDVVWEGYQNAIKQIKMEKETDKNIDLKQAEFFSTGTYNQIYLALRLAIIKLTLSASDSVIFLDDVLTTFDDGRSKDALEVIREICIKDGYQCLLFAGGYLWLVGMVEACSRQAGEIDYFYSSQVVYAFVCCSMPCVCVDRWDIGNVYRQYNTMVG